VVANQQADAATNQSSTNSTKQAPEDILALAETPTATDDAPVKIGAAAPTAAAKVPLGDLAPIKTKSTKRLNSTPLYYCTSRGEPRQLEPSKNHHRSLGKYYETSAQREYYRRHRGGWSYWNGSSPYHVW
jgi:hypothetical protein